MALLLEDAGRPRISGDLDLPTAQTILHSRLRQLITGVPTHLGQRFWQPAYGDSNVKVATSLGFRLVGHSSPRRRVLGPPPVEGPH